MPQNDTDIGKYLRPHITASGSFQRGWQLGNPFIQSGKKGAEVA